jgi:hypothetical protein
MICMASSTLINFFNYPNRQMLKTFSLRYFFNPFRDPVMTTAELVQKNKLNHDCYIYRLKLIDRPLELKIGEHLRVT